MVCHLQYIPNLSMSQTGRAQLWKICYNVLPWMVSSFCLRMTKVIFAVQSLIHKLTQEVATHCDDPILAWYDLSDHALITLHCNRLCVSLMSNYEPSLRTCGSLSACRIKYQETMSTMPVTASHMCYVYLLMNDDFVHDVLQEHQRRRLC